MKLLFLDIDGVLVLLEPGVFVPELQRNLKRIVRSTDCLIVLSSDWRRKPYGVAETRRQLQNYGLDIIGSTRLPEKEDDERPHEIADWIDQHHTVGLGPWAGLGPRAARVENYVCLDDRSLLKEHGGEYMIGHFVQTRLSKGLTGCATEAAIDILNGTPHPNRL